MGSSASSETSRASARKASPSLTPSPPSRCRWRTKSRSNGLHRKSWRHCMQSLTDHARARMQQRGIPTAAVEALLNFGSASHLHSKGRELVYFDKVTRAGLAKANPAADRLARTYAILGSDGTVITVGHRYRRFKRD